MATHIGVTQPRARLLADTRDAGLAAGHNAASLVEVWDAASTGPALLVVVTGPPGSTALHVSTDNNAPAHDPAADAEDDNYVAGGQVELVFTRADVTTVHYAAGKAKPSTAQTTLPAGLLACQGKAGSRGSTCVPQSPTDLPAAGAEPAPFVSTAIPIS